MDSTANSNDVIIIGTGSDSTATFSSGSSDSITIDLSNYTYNYDTMTSVSGSTITLDNITITDTISNWSFIDTVPFENGFPEWRDFQEMCKEYPGLEKTFEHMKSYYNMCKDDWESKKKDDV